MKVLQYGHVASLLNPSRSFWTTPQRHVSQKAAFGTGTNLLPHFPSMYYPKTGPWNLLQPRKPATKKWGVLSSGATNRWWNCPWGVLAAEIRPTTALSHAHTYPFSRVFPIFWMAKFVLPSGAVERACFLTVKSANLLNSKFFKSSTFRIVDFIGPMYSFKIIRCNPKDYQLFLIFQLFSSNLLPNVLCQQLLFVFRRAVAKKGGAVVAVAKQMRSVDGILLRMRILQGLWWVFSLFDRVWWITDPNHYARSFACKNHERERLKVTTSLPRHQWPESQVVWTTYKWGFGVLRIGYGTHYSWLGTVGAAPRYGKKVTLCVF